MKIEIQKQNYFQRNGVIGGLQKGELEILKQASFDGFKVIRHELLNNGEFTTEDYSPPCSFIHKGKLYYYLTDLYTNSISGFFELNPDRDKCVNGRYGVYFEFTETLTKPNRVINE